MVDYYEMKTCPLSENKAKSEDSEEGKLTMLNKNSYFDIKHLKQIDQGN